LKLAGFLKNYILLLSLMRRPAAQYGFRDIVQKICMQVEVGAVAVATGGSRARLHGTRVVPPGSSRFAWIRDHGIHEYEPPDGCTRANQGGCKPSKRLRDERHIRAFTNCANYDISVLAETCARVVTRKIDSNRLMLSAFEQRRDTMPIPGYASRTWDQNKRGCR
jgi:hypothetical protein